MCGIVGHIGEGDSADILIEGLKRLEYRGYDSSGIALLQNDALFVEKEVGKLKNLTNKLANLSLTGSPGIGHTRWATHGGVTNANAHPHIASDKVVVVHNGIIENYRELRAELTEKGHVFASDTDSEVVGHLCVEVMKSYTAPADILKHVLAALDGAYAVAILIKDLPDCLLVARNASPLAIGLGDDACYVASDAMAMSEQTRRVVYLKDNDYAVIRKDGAEIYDVDNNLVKKQLLSVTEDLAIYKDIDVKNIKFDKDEIKSKTIKVLNRIKDIEINVKNKLILTEKYNSYLNS